MNRTHAYRNTCGANTLILLPGLHGTADLFHPLVGVLPKKTAPRLIAYPTNRLLSRRALLETLTADLQNESDMILIAESFSGSLAIEFAAANAARVRALILCCSFIGPPVPGILCYLAAIPIFLRCPIPNFAIRIFLSGRNAPRPLIHEVRHAIRKNSPHVLAHRVQQAAHINAEQALKQCTIPILCLAGTRDRLIGSRSIRRIQKARPDIPIKCIDAPHLLLQLRPAEVWKEILIFLKSRRVPTSKTEMI